MKYIISLFYLLLSGISFTYSADGEPKGTLYSARGKNETSEQTSLVISFRAKGQRIFDHVQIIKPGQTFSADYQALHPGQNFDEVVITSAKPHPRKPHKPLESPYFMQMPENLSSDTKGFQDTIFIGYSALGTGFQPVITRTDIR